jgi:hypothetical protein
MNVKDLKIGKYYIYTRNHEMYESQYYNNIYVYNGQLGGVSTHYSFDLVFPGSDKALECWNENIWNDKYKNSWTEYFVTKLEPIEFNED